MPKADTYSPSEVLGAINFDNISELEFYSYCFNESLRMQPPVYISSTVSMMETVDCGGLIIRKGDAISIDMYRLGHNPKEWIEPEKFFPERFNPEHEYFKTPDGKRRNPYSFSPFLGGQRICVGKTFVELVSKLTLPSLYANFDFALPEGIDPATYKLPANNLVCSREPEVHVTINKRSERVFFQS
jgi:cytochrome P450